MVGVRGPREAGQLGICERSHNKQDGVGLVRAGLDDLVLIHDKVLAQARNRSGRRSDFEVAQAALEEGLVGEHRKRGGSRMREAGGEGVGIEIRPNEAARRRGFLELRDDSGTRGRSGAKSLREAARFMRGGALLQLARGCGLAAAGQIGASLSQNAIEVQQGAPDLMI